MVTEPTHLFWGDIVARVHDPFGNLTIAERHTILAVLEEQPPGLEALRERLLTDEAWLLRERV